MMKTQLRRNLKALGFGIAAGVAFTAWAQSEPAEKSLETANTVLEVVTAPKLAPLEVHPNTSLTVVEQLRHTHYVRKPLDDGISSNIFDNYLDNLDGGRAYFLAADIEQFEKYRYTLDDSLKHGKLDVAFEIFNLFQQRAVNRLQYLLSEINNGLSNIDFNVEEEIEIDRESSPWPASQAAQDNIWRKRLKAAVLSMKLNDKDLEEISTLLTKRYKNRLKQTLQTKSEDAFQLYMNAFASTYDPHTQYFSPRTSQNFNITMSLSLEGIGAVLKAQDDYTEVVRLVPAGPAEKSGGINVADKIISVGQGRDGPLIDIVGWRLDDVVEMIRGPKGSQVRLEVVPSDSGDGVSKIVSITRNTVQLEEQAAQAKLLTLNQAGREYRIGIIDVPTFYIDFRASQQGDPNFRSTTRDVAKLIDQLKAQDIDGLIIDLRNNGGGSLQEADTLTGLFIETGPTVQVKSARRKANIYADTDASTAWDGPMAVMVNRLSASASEIFAGAIQDYGRGLILGSQTFGKGTVQTLIPLSRGQLKITAAKFYRVSGQSTQHQGVLPDIEFPELFDKKLIGESSLDDALPWDMIKPAVYSQAHEIESLLDELRRRHTARVASNVEFNYLNALIAKSRQLSHRTHLSLNESARRDQKAQDDEWRLSLENTLRNAKGKPLAKTLDELEDLEKAEEEALDDQDIAKNSDGEENTLADAEVATTAIEIQKDDAMREEAARVLLDLIDLSTQIAGLENVPTTPIGATAQIPATPVSSTDGS